MDLMKSSGTLYSNVLNQMRVASSSSERPWLQRCLADGELTVSPFKTAVEADRKLLMDFGAGKKRDAHRGALPRIENLMRAVATRVASGDKVLNEYLPILEYLANRCPRSFLKLADLVLELNDGPMGRDMAKGYLRSFIQNADIVEKRIGWLRLGELCRLDDDGKACDPRLLRSRSTSNYGPE